jgi:two-component system sensor histidine kinase/response regulator
MENINRPKPILLVADDQPENLKAVKDILNQDQEEYTFITVPNGKVLLDIAIKKIPDLIITDWEMPEMNGLEAIRLLKENEITKDIPVIMYTGIMISKEHLQIALEAGAVDFIRKPLDPTELIARSKSMLQLSASFRQIKAQKEELEKLNAVKDRLISIISHDVRSPLNGLKSILSLIRLNALSQEELEDITTKVSNHIEQVSHFLNNLLRWAKSQFDNAEVSSENLSIKKIVDEAIDISSFIVQKKKIKVSTEVSTTLMVHADQEMIKIVIRNLLSNALKFCEEDAKIYIKASIESKMVQISVEDTGVGISAEKLPLLFEVAHLSTVGTNQEIGTGLGLTLCKEFVEKNGGKIWVESNLGKGSRFYFTVPLASE